MINKEVENHLEAIADIVDGSTILIGGFGPPGQPIELIDALLENGATDLVVINNNAGAGVGNSQVVLGRSRPQGDLFVSESDRLDGF